ncbi:hypothetical protein L2E82_44444, partial [Cichorium intybus]
VISFIDPISSSSECERTKLDGRLLGFRLLTCFLVRQVTHCSGQIADDFQDISDLSRLLLMPLPCFLFLPPV